MFLSHVHNDHIADVGELMPSAFHFATPVEFDKDANEVVVYDQDGVVVTAFAASHPPIDPGTR